MRGSTNAQPSVPITNSIVYQQSKTVTLTNGVSNPLSWTCTATGNYLAEGTIEVSNASAGQSFVLGLGVDYTNNQWSQQIQATESYLRMNACRVYYLQSGQTVYLDIYSPGGMTTFCSLSIVRLT